jgi:hypothetical protein
LGARACFLPGSFAIPKFLANVDDLQRSLLLRLFRKRRAIPSVEVEIEP